MGRVEGHTLADLISFFFSLSHNRFSAVVGPHDPRAVNIIPFCVYWYQVVQ